MKDPHSLEQAFQEITQEMLDVFIKKHKDYGKDNILEIEELGIALRSTEKMARIRNLLKNNETPKNESIDDTWIDIGVYAVIALLYRKGWFQKLELQNKI